MKLILESWKKFLKEEKEKKIYSFDFDNTLAKYKIDPLDNERTVYDGPHEENLNKLKQLVADGNTVYIVTARHKDEPLYHDISPTPEGFVEEQNLTVDGIYYTNGQLKAPKLLKLGVTEHWDDSKEEITAADAVGIRTHFVPTQDKLHQTFQTMWKKMKAEK